MGAIVGAVGDVTATGCAGVGFGVEGRMGFGVSTGVGVGTRGGAAIGGLGMAWGVMVGGMEATACGGGIEGFFGAFTFSKVLVVVFQTAGHGISKVNKKRYRMTHFWRTHSQGLQPLNGQGNQGGCTSLRCES